MFLKALPVISKAIILTIFTSGISFTINFVSRYSDNIEELTNLEMMNLIENSKLTLDEIWFMVQVAKIVEKENQYKLHYLSRVYKKLNQTKSTLDKDTYGYVKAGNNLGVRLVTDKDVYKVEMCIKGDTSIKTFDNKTKRFEWDELIEKGDI